MTFHALLQKLLRALGSFRNVLLVSTIIRIVLILYSEWHDAHSTVKYTDIDYRVFGDAAHFVLHPDVENHAEGPLGKWLGLGSPYTRQTYRYTPLLAILLAPNEWLHGSFGKYMFAACDILAGVLIYELLVSDILFSSTEATSSSQKSTKPEVKARENAAELRRRASLLTAVHLLNPLVFSISTRGSSESVLSLFVLLTLYYALKEKWGRAAVFLGLSTHWKIYPFIYGVACLGVIGSGSGRQQNQGCVRRLVNGRTVRFAVVSAGVFALLGAVMYLCWGYPFLYESYVYHLHRRDHRHNFSPYFYLIYLTYSFPGEPSPDLSIGRKLLRSPLTSFLPQMITSLGAGLIFGRRKEDLPFAWFVQTFAFVVFNRVCTSQYFLWYTLFLPLLLPKLSIQPRWAIAYAAVWFGTQASWLSEAYSLEFLGKNVFFGLWIRGMIYLAGHCWVLAGIMQGYQA